MLKAIIFDMDNTLVRSEHLHLKAFQETFKKYGINITSDYMNQYWGHGSNKIIPMIIKDFNIDADPKKLVEEKRNNYLKYFANPGVKKIEGLDEFLKKLSKTKIKLAIGSGSNLDNIIQTVEAENIAKYFEILKSGNQVENPKPAPDLFLKIAEELEVNPSECLVFEDSDGGIKAAKSAKMRTVGIATTYTKEELKKFNLDLVIENYIGLEVSVVEALFN